MSTRTSVQSIATWTKKGWISVDINEEQKRQISSVRARLPYIREDMEEISSFRNDVSRLQEVNQEIQTGGIQESLDALPTVLEHILREEDKFYVSSSNKFFRIVDPITQAKDGEWGTDASMQDIADIDNPPSPTRQYLEELGLLGPEFDKDSFVDALGPLAENDNGELISLAPMAFSSARLECIGSDEEECESEEDDFIFGRNREITPILPELSEETFQKLIEIRDNWKVRIQQSISPEERVVAISIMEREMDLVAEKELCGRIDSPWTGFNYSPPRRKHVFIQTGGESDLSDAAEERQKRFFTLFNEAMSCKTKELLYGKDNTSGFYGKIRNMYQHDKEINIEWSTNDYTDKEGNLFKSALSLSKEAFVDSWRQKSNKDEEQLRRSLYALFDRVQETIPAVYENGKCISPSRKTRDSKWRQNRTQALKELYLTKAQWNTIYKALEYMKARIKMNSSSPTIEAKDAQHKLEEGFKRIQTLSDLCEYKRWATKRRFKGVEFRPSLVDRISIRNEQRWYEACRKKEVFLKSRIRLFNNLESLILKTESLDFEVSLVCPYKECDCMAIGIPKFAEIKEGKGFVFVVCECGKKVWHISDTESASNLKTKEECIEALLAFRV